MEGVFLRHGGSVIESGDVRRKGDYGRRLPRAIRWSWVLRQRPSGDRRWQDWCVVVGRLRSDDERQGDRRVRIEAELYRAHRDDLANEAAAAGVVRAQQQQLAHYAGLLLAAAVLGRKLAVGAQHQHRPVRITPSQLIFPNSPAPAPRRAERSWQCGPEARPFRPRPASPRRMSAWHPAARRSNW